MPNANASAVGIDYYDLSSSVISLEGDGINHVSRIHDAVTPSIALLPVEEIMNVTVEIDSVRQSFNAGLSPYDTTLFNSNCARLPFWCALRYLSVEHSQLLWRYTKRNAIPSTININKVLNSFNNSLFIYVKKSDVCIVAIPNLLESWGQENLLRAMPSGHTKVQLLWRPVAACLGYCNTLSKSDTSKLDGSDFAVIEVEPAAISITFLELEVVASGREDYLVPTRYIPNAGNTDRISLPPIDLLLADALLSYFEINITADVLWNLIACQDIVKIFTQEQEKPVNLLIQTEVTWRSVILTASTMQIIAKNAFYSHRSETWIKIASELQSSTDNFHDMCSLSNPKSLAHVVRSFLNKHIELGNLDEATILCCGGWLNSIMLPGNSSATERIFDQLKSNENVVIESENTSLGFVKAGCAIFGIRSKLELPTYFDYLKQMDIVAQVGEEVRRLTLIEGTKVDGGKEYIGNSIDRFSLDIDQKEVKFLLAVEDDAILKELIQEFDVSSNKNESLLLIPKKRPAQGHARIEVHNKTLFGNQHIILDCGEMDASNETVEKLQSEIKRSYPPYIPDVKASSEKWHHLKRHVEFYLGAELLNNSDKLTIDLEYYLNGEFFSALSAAAFDNDDLTGLGRLNVFGSGKENKLPSNDPLVLQFLERLQSDISYASDNSRNYDKLVRAIAWTYQGEHFPELRKILILKLRTDPTSLQTIELTACAQLFRDHSEFSEYFNAILVSFNTRGLVSMNNHINCLRKLLLYRSNALKFINSDKCSAVATWLIRMVDSEIRASNFKVKFKTAITAILFILRRRKYDSAFLKFDESKWVNDSLVHDFSVENDLLVYHIVRVLENAVKIEQIPNATKCLINESNKYVRGSGSGTLPQEIFD